MMENKVTLSLEQLIQGAVSNKSDFVKINNNVYAVIHPNEILYVRKGELNSFREYSINQKREIKNDQLSVTFVPTLDCNLNCIYCYSRGGENKDFMEPSMATKFLKSMYVSEKYDAIRLRFAGGGEPFLNFQCIKEVTETAKQLTDNVSLHCITNGTFNEEQLEWVLENRPHMRISYDGQISQKIQRPYKDGNDSSHTIRRNIEELVKNDVEIVIQTTITSLNVNHMKDIVSEAYELGIGTIKIEPVYVTENSRGSSKLNVFPDEFASKFLDAIGFIKENNIDMQVDTAYFSRPTLGHYCNMATGNIILTPTGDISGCVEITNSCDYHSKDVFYGKFDEDSGKVNFDDSKKNAFRRFHFTNYENCPSCNLKLICRGGCPLRRVWNQNNHSCEITKRIVPQILRLLYEDIAYRRILIRK